MRSDAYCKACQQPIRWAKTITGKSMPIDPTPHDDGNIVIETWRGDHPSIIVFADADAVPANEPLRYRSHFATCPFADQFRKRGMT